MRNTLIVGVGLLLSSGCCAQVKTAVDAYATTVQQQAQAGRELLKRCQANDQPACAGVDGVLVGIEASAKKLQQ